MNKPLLSILVPIYGVEKYIERCARSLFEQSYNNLEFIFINDCTKDNSINILKSVVNLYSHRKNQVRIIHHPYNKGLSAARNTGIDLSHGDYLMHVDSDDYLPTSTAVEELIEPIIFQNADMVVCDFNNVHENKIIKREQIVNDNKREYITDVLLYNTPVSIWARIIKKSLYTDNHIYHIDGINMGEDYVVLSRLIYFAKKIVHIKKTLYNYELNNKNAITSLYKKKDMVDLLNAMRILTVFFSYVEDSSHYLHLLEIATLKAKSNLLFLWAHSNGSSSSDYKLLRQIGKEFKPKLCDLNRKDYFNLNLSKLLGAYMYKLTFKLYSQIKKND